MAKTLELAQDDARRVLNDFKNRWLVPESRVALIFHMPGEDDSYSITTDDDLSALAAIIKRAGGRA